MLKQDKLKQKIWAHEYMDFWALLSPRANFDKYAVSLKPSENSWAPAKLTLEPLRTPKKLSNINHWLSVFHNLVTVYV